jgi:hypothetical protein
MKKIIRMTESDLTNLVKRVIKEQAQIRSVTDTMSKPAPKQSVGKLTDTVSKPAPKQSMGTITLTDKVKGPSAEIWGQNFPCLAKEAKVYPTYAVSSGKTLLYKWNTDDDNEYIENMANEGNFGEVKGGGKYWCNAKDKNKLQIVSFVK